MNNNYTNDNTGSIAETLNLSEETKASADSFISNIKKFLKRIRLNFSHKSEKSTISSILSNLYKTVLDGKMRVAGVFLLTFSIVSLVTSYVTNSSIKGFISDINTFYSIVLIVISLIFLSSNKSLYNLVLSSKFLSSLSIVYSDSGVIPEDENVTSNKPVYSTPFFLGIICGIFTIIYPSNIICTFIISLLCVLLIFNRPECGLLLTVSLLPLLSRQFLLILAFVTFFSLIYKFLLGKRHINFNAATFLIILSFIYVTIRCSVGENSGYNVRYSVYILFYIACISTINLIRSTAMFRRFVLILTRMTRVFAVILAVYYISNMFFGIKNVSEFLELLKVDSLIHSLTSSTFAAPFIAMSIPLNFAYLIGINKNKEILNNVIFLALLIASLIYVSSYALILISILSCVAILIFYNKKYGFLIIPAPFAAYALQKLFNAVPVIYRISVSAESSTDISTSLSIIKSNPLFGGGAGITDYNGNMLINFLITFGFLGLILLVLLVVIMTAKSIRSISASAMKSDKIRFLSIGLLCAQLSFVSVCIFTNTYCNMNIVFMYAVILTVSYISGKCYEADFIDETLVREFNNR